MTTSSRRNPLTLMVLATLWEQPTHPYRIVQILKERSKDRAAKINYGSLYTVVDTLEREGLIESTGVTREGNLPPRTTYRVTPAGKRELIDWVTDMIGQPQVEYPAYLAALAQLPVVSPDRALELLEQRAAALRERQAAERAQLAQARTALPAVFFLEHDYAAALTRADLEFTDRLAMQIRTDSLDGQELWAAAHERDRDLDEPVAAPPRRVADGPRRAATR